MNHYAIKDKEYWRLKKRLAQAQAELNAIPSGGASWSAVARWTARHRKRIGARIESLSERIALIRHERGLPPESDNWQPRRTTRADAIIRRKFAQCQSASFA
jgi:hypothetical protein